MLSFLKVKIILPKKQKFSTPMRPSLLTRQGYQVVLDHRVLWLTYKRVLTIFIPWIKKKKNCRLASVAGPGER